MLLLLRQSHYILQNSIQPDSNYIPLQNFRSFTNKERKFCCPFFFYLFFFSFHSNDLAFDMMGYVCVLLNDIFSTFNGIYMKKKLDSRVSFFYFNIYLFISKRFYFHFNFGLKTIKKKKLFCNYNHVYEKGKGSLVLGNKHC